MELRDQLPPSGGERVGHAAELSLEVLDLAGDTIDVVISHPHLERDLLVRAGGVLPPRDSYSGTVIGSEPGQGSTAG